MRNLRRDAALVVVAGTLGVWASVRVSANMGPFTVNFPGGDTSAKGVLAPIHFDLMPGREERLRVVKEDLAIVFEASGLPAKDDRYPRARVTATYQIENPTDNKIEIDFGFPILRGYHARGSSNNLAPYALVELEGAAVPVDVILPREMYGVLRRSARAVIDRALDADVELGARVRKVWARGSDEEGAEARRVLASYLTTQLKWSERDAAVFVAYAGIGLGVRVIAADGPTGVAEERAASAWPDPAVLEDLRTQNLGVLAAIGEEKATQMLAHLAGLFDADAVMSYEALFRAWGGDPRQRAVDPTTGDVRLRVSSAPAVRGSRTSADPTVYTRMDYLDEEALRLTDAERDACRTILQKLPVTFAFAPMHLLHYRVEFPARSTRTVKVSFSQFAYEDGAAPRSYQVAYVVHPASFWAQFGPIHLTITAPEATPVRASVPCTALGGERRELRLAAQGGKGAVVSASVCAATVVDKTGELFVAVDARKWDKLVSARSE
jgi:hypothetical protein